MALVKYNNNSISAVTSAASIPTGAMTLISTTTASSSATISITSGIDSTYPIYLFKFINIHPSNNDVVFQTNFRDGSTDYDATKTTTTFNAHHSEGDATGFAYDTNADIAQGTGFQLLAGACGNDNDQCISGSMWLFNPSSTTFVKHFISRISGFHEGNYAFDFPTAGYCNVTAAIDGVQFKYDSGNIDAGTIKLYGIKDS